MNINTEWHRRSFLNLLQDGRVLQLKAHFDSGRVDQRKLERVNERVRHADVKTSDTKIDLSLCL